MSRVLQLAKRVSDALLPGIYSSWACAGAIVTLSFLTYTFGDASQGARKARYGDSDMPTLYGSNI